MADRRQSGNGSGHYRGEAMHTDPSENVKELVELQALRQAEGLAALTERFNERDKLREVHRLEIAAKDAEIQAKETERIDAVNAVEKERVNAVIAAGQQAVLLANTESKAVAAALAVQVETARKTNEAQVESSASALRASNEASAKALATRIEPLEQARFAAVGVKEQRTEGKQDNRWLIGFLMGLPSLILTIFALILLFINKAPTP